MSSKATGTRVSFADTRDVLELNKDVPLSEMNTYVSSPSTEAESRVLKPSLKLGKWSKAPGEKESER